MCLSSGCSVLSRGDSPKSVGNAPELRMQRPVQGGLPKKCRKGAEAQHAASCPGGTPQKVTEIRYCPASAPCGLLRKCRKSAGAQDAASCPGGLPKKCQKCAGAQDAASCPGGTPEKVPEMCRSSRRRVLSREDSPKSADKVPELRMQRLLQGGLPKKQRKTGNARRLLRAQSLERVGNVPELRMPAQTCTHAQPRWRDGRRQVDNSYWTYYYTYV